MQGADAVPRLVGNINLSFDDNVLSNYIYPAILPPIQMNDPNWRSLDVLA